MMQNDFCGTICTALSSLLPTEITIVAFSGLFFGSWCQQTHRDVDGYGVVTEERFVFFFQRPEHSCPQLSTEWMHGTRFWKGTNCCVCLTPHGAVLFYFAFVQRMCYTHA